jgi:hypothetical protein
MKIGFIETDSGRRKSNNHCSEVVSAGGTVYL